MNCYAPVILTSPNQRRLGWLLSPLPLLAVLLCLAASPAWAADQSPSRTISGLNTPYGLAVLADGSLAVANRGDHSVKVYASDASGIATPLRTISGSNTGLNSPSGVAVLADGLAVANFSSGKVTVYASDASGNATPLRAINAIIPVGLAVLADGLAVSGSSRPETPTKSSHPRPVLSLDASLHAATT